MMSDCKSGCAVTVSGSESPSAVGPRVCESTVGKKLLLAGNKRMGSSCLDLLVLLLCSDLGSLSDEQFLPQHSKEQGRSSANQPLSVKMLFFKAIYYKQGIEPRGSQVQ